MKKGQINFIFVAVGVVVALIALILAQQVLNQATLYGAGGNFTAGSIQLLVLNNLMPIMAIGVLLTIVAAAISRGR